MSIFDEDQKNSTKKLVTTTKKDWSHVTKAEKADDSGGDEGGSGGAGKKMLGFFKREKLHHLIAQEKLDAKVFDSFLTKERTDESKIKESNLAQAIETQETQKEKQAKEEAKQRSEEARSEFEQSEMPVVEKMDVSRSVDSAKQAAKEAFAKTAQSFLQYETATNPVSNLVTKMTGQAILGGKQAGVNYGLYHGDTIGSVRQGSVKGDRAEGDRGEMKHSSFALTSNSSILSDSVRQSTKQQAGNHRSAATSIAKSELSSPGLTISKIGRRS